MERPGGGIGTDVPILHGGNLGRGPRMHHPLRIPVEERQVQRLIDPTPFTLIGNERIWIYMRSSVQVPPRTTGVVAPLRAPITPKCASRLRLPRTPPAMTSDQSDKQSGRAASNAAPLAFPRW